MLESRVARDIIVKVALNAEEYLALEAVAEDEGMGHSTLLRMLLKSKIRVFAMSQSSPESNGQQMPEKVQPRSHDSTLNPVPLFGEEK